MFGLQQNLLPIIKHKSFLRKNTLSISKTSKPKPESKAWESQRWQRKINTNLNQLFCLQKRCLSQKRFSLKRITTDKILKTSKQSEKNTDDNSQSQKNCQSSERLNINIVKSQTVTFQAVHILENIKEVGKTDKIYEKTSQKRRNPKKDRQEKLFSKNKYKCLVNQHVFDKKPKHYGSDGTKNSKNKQNRGKFPVLDFWDNINQSLILESSRRQQPSRQLVQLVQNLITQ